ncbi:MAG: hypothetical protein UT55_C0002G0006 [Candidatus Peregrinibacteria bacterium GW2011_GWE2_39_6]|nr:MAG: hypothetical protein UT36_C0002G0052 [Candidatus Peregrinibacteria bacterium GW2011_GWF2_39_17]KKR26744.1 MAG: hypothetical protein UT55_C0002G0006 [Candidatus Peregrinibacteria bacterium GW2011_GWE2_39_6]
MAARYWWVPVLMLIIVALFFLLLPHTAWAVEDTKTMTDVKSKLSAFMIIAFQMLNIVLYPLLIVISSLMDNEILIGPAMESKLLMVWVEIRNWVNIAFVLILVVIALYNVVGIADEGSNYALKSILPKIVIGLVAVNFSFLAVKILIDATNVVTIAVYALPTDLIKWQDERIEIEKRLCTVITQDASTSYEEVVTPRPTDNASILSSMFCSPKEGVNDDGVEVFSGNFNGFGSTFFDSFGGHNVAFAMMVNMGLVTDVELMTTSGTLDTLSSITFHTLFGVLMFLLFGFAYAALGLVLLARLVILWICLALSPLIVLLFVFPDLASAGGGQLDLKDKFFKHLLAPLMIGVVFSIGFAMLKVLKTSTSGSWMGAISNMDFESLGDTNNIANMVSAYGKDITNFQDLLIAVSAVAIIWVGVFAAAEGTIASTITGQIKAAGETTGKFLAKLPTYATVIPIPGAHAGGEKTSLGAMLGMLPTFIGDMQQNWRSKPRDLLNQLGVNTSGNLGVETDDAIKDIQRAIGDSKFQAQHFNQYLTHNRHAMNNPEQVRRVLLEGFKDKRIEAVIPEDDKEMINQLNNRGRLYQEIFKDFSPKEMPDPGKWGTGGGDSVDQNTGNDAENPSAASSSSQVTNALTVLSNLSGAENLEGNDAVAGQIQKVINNEPAAATQLFVTPTDSVLVSSIKAFNGLPVSTQQEILSKTPLNSEMENRLDETAFSPAVQSAVRDLSFGSGNTGAIGGGGTAIGGTGGGAVAPGAGGSVPGAPVPGAPVSGAPVSGAPVPPAHP